MGGSTGRVAPEESPALRATVAGLCTWEAIAITTRRIPTLSHGMWKLPRNMRVGVCLVAGALLADHFFSRRFC